MGERGSVGKRGTRLAKKGYHIIRSTLSVPGKREAKLRP